MDNMPLGMARTPAGDNICGVTNYTRYADCFSFRSRTLADDGHREEGYSLDLLIDRECGRHRSGRFAISDSKTRWSRSA